MTRINLPDCVTVRARSAAEALRTVCEENGLTVTGTRREGPYNNCSVRLRDADDKVHWVWYEISRCQEKGRGEEYTILFGEVSSNVRHA